MPECQFQCRDGTGSTIPQPVPIMDTVGAAEIWPFNSCRDFVAAVITSDGYQPRQNGWGTKEESNKR